MNPARINQYPCRKCRCVFRTRVMLQAHGREKHPQTKQQRSEAAKRGNETRRRRLLGEIP